MEDFIIRVGDIRKTGHCVAGMRRWAALHGIDFRDFLNNGISAARLLATKDHVAIDIVAKIKARQDG